MSLNIQENKNFVRYVVQNAGGHIQITLSSDKIRVIGKLSLQLATPAGNFYQIYISNQVTISSPGLELITGDT